MILQINTLATTGLTSTNVRRAAMALAVMMLTATTAWAQATRSVTYYDPVSMTNKTVTANYIGNQTLTSGWYYYDPELACHEAYTINGTVNLILLDDPNREFMIIRNINVTEGNTLNIYAQSTNYDEMGCISTATFSDGSDYETAAISGGSGESCGTINIYGGIIKAEVKQGSLAAAIGGGYKGHGGTVSIHGGYVTAIAKDGGAGIGSGYFSEATTNTGTVNIYGGTVTASGGVYGTAGIGGGYHASGGTINITGGTVTAQGGTNGATAGGAAIGGGNNGASTSVTISGGVVNATGGSYAVAIGGGYNGDGGTINISGGQVTITGGTNASAIGYHGSSSSLTANISLGWTHATDFIDNTSHLFYGTVTLSKPFVKHNALTTAVTTGNWMNQKIVPAYSVATTTPTHGSLGVSATLAGAGANITVSPQPATGYTVGTVSYNDGSNHTITPSGNTYAFTMPSHDVTVSATFVVNPDIYFGTGNDGSETKPYTISSADGWNFFCDCLQDNTTWNRFSGKYVKLGGDIGTAQNPITRMAGSSNHDFCGTFDGQGYTLYVDISSDSRDYTAPFSYVSETTPTGGSAVSHPAIRNLNVTGTVTATKNYAGGIVGAFWGTLTIENCTSSVAITTNNKHAAGFIGSARGDVTITNCLSSGTITGSISGDGTHAGFIGENSGTLNITGCSFTGSLLTTNGTTHCAGFVGYNGGTLTISNSLFAPASVNVGGTESATFARGYAPTLTNSYYTQSLGTAQGTAAYIYTPATTGFVPANVGAEGTTYDVSGITAYASGLKYGGRFYIMKADVSLANDADNSGSIIDKQVADVRIQGRTLYKDGDWNTLCLPFDVTIAGSVLDGADVRELDNANISDATLTLNFTAEGYVTKLTAGTPYIIKWDGDGTNNLVNPVFTDVTVSTDTNNFESTDGSVQFKGTYNNLIWTTQTPSILLMGANNALFWPDGVEDSTLGACRAYFQLADGQQARQFVLNFGEDNATGIIATDYTDYTDKAGVCYTLDGRKLNTKPTKKGVYVVNGKKVVLK